MFLRKNVEKAKEMDLFFLGKHQKPIGDLLAQVCNPARKDVKHTEHFTCPKMRHTITTWAEQNFEGEEPRIVAANLEHTLRTNLQMYSHKHKRHAAVYTQCIQKMISKLPGHMTAEEIREAHEERAAQILEERDDNGELVIDNMVIRNSRELGIPSMLAVDADDEEVEQHEVDDGPEYNPKAAIHSGQDRNQAEDRNQVEGTEETVQLDKDPK